MPGVDSTGYRPLLKEQYADERPKPKKKRSRIVRALLRKK